MAKSKRDRLSEMIKAEFQKSIDRVERLMNAEVPMTGERVLYVALSNRSARRHNDLSARAQEVWAFLVKQQMATSVALQAGLKVNRNVIAGAIHELKQAGLVRTRAIE